MVQVFGDLRLSACWRSRSATSSVTRRFALMMLALLIRPCWAILVVLPAQLLGPLGKWFEARAGAGLRSEANARDAVENALGGRSGQWCPASRNAAEGVPYSSFGKIKSCTQQASPINASPWPAHPTKAGSFLPATPRLLLADVDQFHDHHFLPSNCL